MKQTTIDKALPLKEIYTILMNDKSIPKNNTYKNDSTSINDIAA